MSLSISKDQQECDAKVVRKEISDLISYAKSVVEMEGLLYRAARFIKTVVNGGDWEGCVGREIVLDIQDVLKRSRHGTC